MLGTGTEALPPETLEELVVAGPERVAQRGRLSGPTLLFTVDDRAVAIAAFTCSAGELTISECALLRRLNGDEELAELVVDGLETVALATAAERLSIFTTSRVLRRTVRAMGYVPRTSADRHGFERRFSRTHPPN